MPSSIFNFKLYFLTQDALEHKQKMEAENKALKEKLDREVSAQVK